MTKKHYIALAKIIKDEIERAEKHDDNYGLVQKSSFIRLANSFAKSFGELNPRFDAARFLSACGIE